MTKMTVAWLLIYVGSIVWAFVNPVYGVIGYLFEYYLRPSLHWWGTPLPDLRWNLTIFIVASAAYVCRRYALPACRQLRNPALPWLLGLGLSAILITPVAASWDDSYTAMLQFLKMVGIYLLITQVVRTRKDFDLVVAVHIAGAAWWGWEQYLHPQRIQSRLANVGSSDTLNDNLASAHLLTVVPFVFVYLLSMKDKRLRALALIAAPFVLNLLILCNSRGGMVGLLVGTLAAFLLARRGHRIRLVGATVVIAAVFWSLADPEFKARQQTTTEYQNDGSALQRLESWQAGWRLIRDHPFGAGGNGFEVLSPTYIPDIVNAHDGERRAPHNTYVLVLSDWGVQGMFFYMAFIGATFLMLHRVRQRAGSDAALFYRAFAIQVALLATMTAATFSDRFYGESFYWMCALAVVLYRMPDEVSEVAVAAPTPAFLPRRDLVPARA